MGENRCKNMKKIWVLLTTIVILVGLVGSSVMPTYATTAHSMAEAVEWAKSQMGQSVDYDGNQLPSG